MLAGLLKAPSRYAPTANLQRAQDRARCDLGLMHDQGYLTMPNLPMPRPIPRNFRRRRRRGRAAFLPIG